MSKELLEKIINSLSEMINYADDGMVSRDDPDFEEFYEKVDNANKLLNELTALYEEIILL